MFWWANSIKSALLSEFSSRFGPNVSIYRSEIITVVQNVTGVSHCRLLEPQSNIFFDDVEIDDFTQQELMEYAPEYIYFTEDEIYTALKKREKMLLLLMAVSYYLMKRHRPVKPGPNDQKQWKKVRNNYHCYLY